MSPFEVDRDDPGYSSSEESAEDFGNQLSHHLRAKFQSDFGSQSSSLHSSASSVANNHGDSLEGTPSQPQSNVEELQNISVVCFSRNNAPPDLDVDKIIYEIEHMSVNTASLHDGRTGSPPLEENTCKERDTIEEGDCAISNCLDIQENLSWITDLQVSWQPIGQGSFGKVYRAVDGDQVYALKIAEASSKRMLRKLAEEAHANMRLKHENVVNCFKCCFLTRDQETETLGHEVSAMELWMLQQLCEGGTLHDAIEGPAYPPGKDRESRESILTNLSTQIARGLEYIHSHGQIHGDLSSNNVLLDVPQEYAGGCTDPTVWEHLTLKIADFGRSKYKAAGSCRTDSIGTVIFMPPEAVTTGSLRPSTDMYAYGIILIHLWTGVLPYQGCKVAQIIFQMSQGCTPQVPDDMDAPECIRNIIRECVSPLSADRPTATEVLGMLNGDGRLSVAEANE